MNFKPILFSTEMVQAILDGRKTQTRRIVKARKGESLKYELWEDEIRKPNIEPIIYSGGGAYSLIDNTHLCPYGEPGDVLWVRETWQITNFLHPEDENYGYIYKASENGRAWENNDDEWKWKPSIHMPKEACRIFLKIKSIGVEHLQDISEEDAIAEGIEKVVMQKCPLSGNDLRTYRNYLTNELKWFNATLSFRTLWEKINGLKSWDHNPLVWVIQFERIEKPENFK